MKSWHKNRKLRMSMIRLNHITLKMESLHPMSSVLTIPLSTWRCQNWHSSSKQCSQKIHWYNLWKSLLQHDLHSIHVVWSFSTGYLMLFGLTTDCLLICTGLSHEELWTGIKSEHLISSGLMSLVVLLMFWFLQYKMKRFFLVSFSAFFFGFFGAKLLN